ncbi:jg9254 [Pararge aegeria aegeria]|uniref:Jg9254 protein n=1 Tax=Pararge aegeria aegeria TaxID=348720 RepID=A0A8S4QPN0_9NEOP|nr:jg9254 [Pararge aegeria aegeria]
MALLRRTLHVKYDIEESINDSTCTEDKENISVATVKTSFTSKNENLLTLNHTSETPEQNIPETLENNTTTEQLNICENAILTPEKPGIMEDSSSSPFQLPPEFIADSSSSLPIIDTPKKLKKINIQNDSMEISENNQIVNIDLIKIETNDAKDFLIPDKKCAFKFSPLNKDIKEKNLDIDLESFKNQYLNEVDRKTNCKFEHNHINLENNSTKLRTAIDFALDAMKEPPKRKLPNSDNVTNRKRKPTKMVRKKRKQCNKDQTDENECYNKKVCTEKSDMKDSTNRKRKHPEADFNVKQEYTNNSGSTSGGNVKKRKYKKYKKNHNTELSIRNRNIKLKIRFKSQELNLKITKPKKRGRKVQKGTAKVMKQYVLQYAVNQKSPKECIIRPDAEVTPIKKKYLKTEKPSDHLKQTSIASFFKVSPKM